MAAVAVINSSSDESLLMLVLPHLKEISHILNWMVRVLDLHFFVCTHPPVKDKRYNEYKVSDRCTL